ncbi:MAG: TetR/AcrR family transcriptional regulator [Acidobacteriota bacterium]|jgi:AcrR family transcriptional regulator|nr:TetR/AcrR family transcriptional regulator [Bryobacteraceae bacterium CoA2 C42]
MVATILEAATRVLRKYSLEGFNTNRVAATAGVSIGSLYQYFPNKDALMAALIEHVQQQLRISFEKRLLAVQGKSLEVALTGLAEFCVEQQFTDPVFAAAIDQEERRLTLAQVQFASRQSILNGLEGLFQSYGVPTSRVAAADCIAIAKALVEAEPHPSADLADRIRRAVSGYLRERGLEATPLTGP